MSTLSYPLAKNLLSGVEKERIICTYLNSTDPLAHVDWTKAAQEFGSASIESYRKLMQNTAKKIKQAMDAGVEPEVEIEGAKKKGGRKRKAEGEGEWDAASKKKGGKGKKAAVDREQSEQDVDEQAEVAPKKRGGKGKKIAVKQESEAEDGE